MPLDTPLKVLMFQAEPNELARLRLTEEYKKVRARRQRMSGDRTRVEVVHWPDAQPIEVSDQLRDEKPDVVHFCGHGTGRGGLAFVDAQRGLQLVPNDSLGRTFRGSKGVRCVILNACLSLDQAAEILPHVPYVVGMAQEIGDRAAVDFADGFYAALFDGSSYEEAFAAGCGAIEMSSLSASARSQLVDRHVGVKSSVVDQLPQHLIPVLLTRPDVFVCSHAADDKWVDLELSDQLSKAKLRVSGDWECRQPGGIPGGKALALRVCRHILVVFTPENHTAPEGVDVHDRRVWGLMRQKCTLPDGFDQAYVFDGGTDLKKALADLVGEFAPPVPLVVDVAASPAPAPAANRELAKEAKLAIDTLRELVQTDEFREAKVGIVKELELAEVNLRELRGWKQLHELMHTVADALPAFEEKVAQLKEAVTIPTGDLSEDERAAKINTLWEQVGRALSNQVLVPLGALVDSVTLPVFKSLKPQRFADAYEDLVSRSRDKQFDSFNQAVGKLGTNLNQSMRVVEVKLFEIAEQVNLEPLTDLLTVLAYKLGRLPDLRTGKVRDVSEFRDKVDSIRQLHRRLDDLVENHRILQDIDSEVRELDGQAPVSDIRRTWGRLGNPLDLLRPAGEKDFTAAVRHARREVDAAFGLAATDDPKAVNRFCQVFFGFCNVLSTAFLNADKALLAFCDELKSVGDSLTKAITEMQQ